MRATELSSLAPFRGHLVLPRLMGPPDRHHRAAAIPAPTRHDHVNDKLPSPEDVLQLLAPSLVNVWLGAAAHHAHIQTALPQEPEGPTASTSEQKPCRPNHLVVACLSKNQTAAHLRRLLRKYSQFPSK